MVEEKNNSLDFDTEIFEQPDERDLALLPEDIRQTDANDRKKYRNWLITLNTFDDSDYIKHFWEPKTMKGMVG